VNNLHNIIQQLQKDLACPVCGQSFSISEIKIRALFDHTIIVQTICDNHHVTMFMTYYQSRLTQTHPITDQMMVKFHQDLKEFNGDFQTEWLT